MNGRGPPKRSKVRFATVRGGCLADLFSLADREGGGSGPETHIKGEGTKEKAHVWGYQQFGVVMGKGLTHDL